MQSTIVRKIRARLEKVASGEFFQFYMDINSFHLLKNLQ